MEPPQAATAASSFLPSAENVTVCTDAVCPASISAAACRVRYSMMPPPTLPTVVPSGRSSSFGADLPRGGAVPCNDRRQHCRLAVLCGLLHRRQKRRSKALGLRAGVFSLPRSAPEWTARSLRLFWPRWQVRWGPAQLPPVQHPPRLPAAVAVPVRPGPGCPSCQRKPPVSARSAPGRPHQRHGRGSRPQSRSLPRRAPAPVPVQTVSRGPCPLRHPAGPAHIPCGPP